MERITGFSRFKVIGKKEVELWGGHMPASFYKKMRKTILIDKKEFVGTVKNRRKSGEYYFAKIKIAPALDAHNNIKFFVSIQRDVTREQIIDNAKNNFIRIASHQLRTPMTAIYWITDSLVHSMKDKRLSKKDRRYLEDLSTSTHRAVGLIEDLLNLSRIQGIEKLPMKRFSLYSVLRDIVKSLQVNPKIKKRKIVVKRNKAAQVLVVSDEEIVKNILQILLNNALAYSDPESLVEIVLEKKRKWIISVTNSGPTIPPEEKVNIFTMFFRGEMAKKIRPEGSGIGLFTAKTMADKLNAKLSFQSQDGKTTFSIALPSASSAKAMTNKKSIVRKKNATSKKKKKS